MKRIAKFSVAQRTVVLLVTMLYLLRSTPGVLQNCAEAVPTASSLGQPAEVELADSLKIVALVQQFRSRGHLVAQLDPLRRVAYGPWFGDIGVASPWCEVGFAVHRGGIDFLSYCRKGRCPSQVRSAATVTAGRLEGSHKPQRASSRCSRETASTRTH